MSTKRQSPLPKRPKAVKKAPSVTQEPPKPLGAPPVPPLPPAALPVILDGPAFDKVWEGLSPKGKLKVRNIAERHNLTLRGVLNQWPQFREG